MAKPSKCVNCGQPIEHPIVDWSQQYEWCAECWAEYLKDYRKAQSETS